MEELQTLINVISKNKVKQIDVIGNPNGHSSQAQLLYEKIAEGTITSDEQIIETFFPDGGANSSFYNSRLKKKLKNRLINTLFFIDVNRDSFNDYNRAYFICYRQAAAVKILLNLYARKAAIPLAEKTLLQAQKFEFTELVLSLARDLRFHYGNDEGNKKKFEEMNQIVHQMIRIFQAELIAEEYFTAIMSNMIRTTASNAEYQAQSIRYVQELEVLSTQVSSPRFNFLAYLVFSLRYEIVSDYTNMLAVCEKAILYFEKKKGKVSITNIFQFAIRIFVCNIYLKKYEAAKKAAKKCEKYSRDGTVNRFATWEYTMTLYFHAGHLQEAYELCKKTFAHPAFDKLSEPTKERWYILEAYVQYFIFVKQIIPDADDSIRTFRLGRFLNEVPVYSKDKRGGNISIIILQILFLLRQKEYNKIIDRMESLNTYSYRYLRQDDTFRSNCFIKMLLTLPEASFHKKGVLRKADKYVKRLAEMPLHKAKQTAELEIVPYETLWEMVLQELDEDWH